MFATPGGILPQSGTERERGAGNKTVTGSPGATLEERAVGEKWSYLFSHCPHS